MSPRKKKASSETVQATLTEVLDSKPETRKKRTTKATKKSSPKKASRPKSKKASTKKAAKPKKAAKESKPTKKTTKKTTTKKKKAKKAAKKKPKPTPKAVEGTPLTDLPGVGSKLAEKIIEAGYPTVEKLSKARASSLSKRVDGFSEGRAKKLIKLAKEYLELIAIPTEGAEESESVPKPFALTDVPGVGKKLALKLQASGYDSVARLSRARPDSLSRAISGLSIDKARELIASAKEMLQKHQLQSVVEEPRRVATVAAPPKKKKKEPKAKKAKSAPKPASKSKPESVSKGPTSEPQPEVEPVSTTTTKPKPKRKRKKKIIRKQSGLPVPDAVVKAAEEMKRKWKEAERRSRTTPQQLQTATVEVVPLTADETRERLIEIATEILNEIMMTGRPVFEIPSRSADNIVWDEIRDLLLLGMRKVSRPYHSLASVVDATRTARIMEIVYNLVKSGLHATKREVYYSDVNLFRDQKYSDKIIEDIASMLNTTRDSIHVVASARGSAMGRVIIRDGGDLIDLTKMGTGGWAITPFLDQVEIVESDAEFIILSEKDAAVMRLAEAKYWNRQPCIILTGKGSGDIATRAFLKRLVKELEIPAFALVDSDPYGHYIYSVFLRGSKRLSYESPFIATPELKLLGVLSRDLDEYNIPKAVRIPMEQADIKRVKDMLKEPFVQANKEWVEDLKLMLKMREKAEIQAFASHSFQFLTDEYLPRKLETGDWI